MRRWSALLLVAALLTSPASGAQETQAQRLFNEGRAAMEAGRLELACSKFEESLGLEGSLGPLLNLAECSQKRGRLLRAQELWKEALGRLPQGDARRDLATRNAADLERRLPRLVLGGAPTSATLFVDGRAATSGAPLAVDPGRHVVSVTVDGATRTVEVEVTEGESKPVDLAPTRDDGIAPHAAGEAAPTDDPSYTPAIVAFSIGGAGLALFGITGALWLSEAATIDDECPARVCRDQTGLDAGSSARGLAVANGIGLGVAVVGAATGGILMWRASSDAADGATAVRMRGTGLTFDGRF